MKCYDNHIKCLIMSTETIYTQFDGYTSNVCPCYVCFCLFQMFINIALYYT